MSDHLIVIAVFNAAATIADVVERARLHGPVLVVDDGSSDDSGARAAAAGAEVISLGARSGSGAALRRGFAEGVRRGAERVVTLDGDGRHDPGDIPRLLKAAVETPRSLVIGGRLGPPAERPEHPERLGEQTTMPAGRLAALRVTGFFVSWLTGVAVTDTQSGFRVYPLALLSAVMPRHGGVVLESEMLLRAVEHGFGIVEVPITPIAARRSACRRFARRGTGSRSASSWPPPSCSAGRVRPRQAPSGSSASSAPRGSGPGIARRTSPRSRSD